MSDDLRTKSPAGRIQGHLEAARRALASGARADPKAVWDQSYDTLVRGELVKGWQQYEARWQVPGLIKPERKFTHPRWDGRPFPDQTLLLHYEQGLGDTLMFVRYAPLVKALGGRVVLAAQAQLAEVVATCPGIDTVVPKGTPPPPFDLHCPLLSLPWLFRTDLESIPADIPYLQVPDRVPNRAELDGRLAQSEGQLRIGLAWQGSTAHPRDRERSIPIADLQLLAELPPIAWFSFQREWGQDLPLAGMEDLGPLLGNFSDTAYALQAMDLLITVDTAIAHLAGALGVPVLLLITHVPDWRWLLEREDSPWYPTMRLYRQPRAGDWYSVLRNVVDDLSEGGS